MAVNPENLLISSILRDGDLNTALSEGVKSEFFHSYPDEWEWLTTYHKRFKRMPTKAAFKTKFGDFFIRPVNDTEHYSLEVRKNHARLELVQSLHEVTGMIATGDVDGAMKSMHDKLIAIAAETASLDEVDIVGDWKSIYAEAERRAKAAASGGTSGIATGFPTLDDVTGGLQPGHITIVAGRLGSMKSWIMQGMATAALMTGDAVQFNTLEMSRSEVGMRIHTLLSPKIGRDVYSNLDLQRGHGINLREYKDFVAGLRDRLKTSLMVTDGSRGRIGPMSIAAQIERNSPAVVFIDYFQLLDGCNGADWQSINRVSGDMKGLAVQHNIPIVAGSQFNRNATAKEMGGPEDIAGADGIGQDADCVLALKKRADILVEAKVVKWRHGPEGPKFFIHVDPAHGHFGEVEEDEADDILAQHNSTMAVRKTVAKRVQKPAARFKRGVVTE